MIEVDVRGFSDHVPIVRTQKAIKENPNKVLFVLADTGVTRENVSHLAQGKGYTVKVEHTCDEYLIQLIPPNNKVN